jgi:MYXO-CTERM domain-containing protein
MRTLSWSASLVLAATLGGCLWDHDPPVIVDLTPDDGADARGARAFPFGVAYTDDSDVHVSLLVDGELVEEPASQCTDDDGCTAEAEIPTTGLAIGDHELEVVLEDDSGNTTREQRLFSTDDILTVKSVRVTGESDGFGPLELEVYAFTEDNVLVGCAGDRHGMSSADYSDITYTLDASLIDVMGFKLSTLDLGTAKIRLEVWEDDDDPVCPQVPAPQGNTLIGATEAFTVDEWRAQTAPMAFGRVSDFAVAWTRDLPEPAAQDMGPPPDDDWDIDFGQQGGGCATTGGSGGGALALVLAALVAGRRRRRSQAAGTSL